MFEKIKEILADQLHIDAEKITMESDIVKDLGADSLDVIELLMNLESEFDITVEDDQQQALKTVGDIVNYIEKNKN